MKRNNLLLLLSVLSTLFFLMIIVSNILNIKTGISNNTIVLSLIIQSFLLSNGLLFSKVKIQELIPKINVLLFIKTLGVYVITMVVTISVFAILILGLNMEPDTYLVQQKLQNIGPIVFLLAVIIAPICEEIFFRATLVPKFGIIISACIFALVHISYGSVFEIIAALIFGLSLGYVYKKWGLNHSILLHMLINLVSVTMMFLVEYI